MDNATEEWKAVPGFEHYEASSSGRVRSLDRVATRLNRWGQIIEFRWKGRILKPIAHRGYVAVKLGKPNLMFGLHQVVAMAFHGPCPEGMVIDHKNTIKTDNRPENLEYVTNSENVRRAHVAGLMHAKNEGNGRCKLSDQQVCEIRKLSSCNTATAIAKQFGVSTSHVARLIKNQVRAGLSNA
jgi:hypothetical protein